MLSFFVFVCLGMARRLCLRLIYIIRCKYLSASCTVIAHTRIHSL